MLSEDTRIRQPPAQGCFSELRRGHPPLDANDLAWLNGFQMCKASGHKLQEVMQTVGLRTENYNCDLSAG